MLRNTREGYGWLAQLFHWTTAVFFIAAYAVVYYVIWVLEVNTHPYFFTVLNIHWVLGILIGVVVIPRLWWKWRQVAPDEVPGSPLEHLLARSAHRLLYALLIVMPITGYIGTRDGTDFGLFEIPSFKDTALFQWISATWNIGFPEFEKPIDVVHRFIGKWVAWGIVLLHVAAALFHHWVRRDATLRRMLPSG